MGHRRQRRNTGSTRPSPSVIQPRTNLAATFHRISYLVATAGRVPVDRASHMCSTARSIDSDLPSGGGPAPRQCGAQASVPPARRETPALPPPAEHASGQA